MLKTANLVELTKLIEDETISEEYVNYLTRNVDGEYRHFELKCIKKLLDNLNLDSIYLDGFYYGYLIPHAGKELDLLKIGSNAVINIELKTGRISDEKILRQLKQNKYYLHKLNMNIVQFTYVSSTNELFYLSKTEELENSNFDFLKTILVSNKVNLNVDLDMIYNDKKNRVSPFDNTKDFLQGNYYLTLEQEEIKEKIISENRIYCLKGETGSGKTLLLYDIAKSVGKLKKCLIIHNGTLSKQQKYLNSLARGFKIISSRYIYRELEKGYDFILVDETEQISERNYFILRNYILGHNKTGIFALDERQILVDNKKNIVSDLKENGKTFYLKSHLRHTDHLMKFINYLFDLDLIKQKVNYDDIKVVYSSDDVDEIIRNNKSYYYIDYRNKGQLTSVFGKEYDNVLMVLGSDFYYDNNKLKSRNNTNYSYLKALYTGLTRARRKILLVITDKVLLNEILKIVTNEYYEARVKLYEEKIKKD